MTSPQSRIDRSALSDERMWPDRIWETNAVRARKRLRKIPIKRRNPFDRDFCFWYDVSAVSDLKRGNLCQKTVNLRDKKSSVY